MKKQLLFLSVFFLIPFSCSIADAQAPLALPAGETVAVVGNPQLSAPAIAQGESINLPQPKREWTVMVFANGKNNLAADIWADLG